MKLATMLPSLGKMLEAATGAQFADLPGYNTRGDYNISLAPIDAAGCN
jgi:hypothetical protein